MLFICVKDKKSQKEEEDGEKVSEHENAVRENEDSAGQENHEEDKNKNESSNPVAAKTKEKKSGVCSIL